MTVPPVADAGAVTRPGRRTFLPFAPPSIGEEEIAEVVATLRSGWITTGPRTAAFEQAFADALGAPAALALNSCTAGLHVALVAAGIRDGDEVITSTLTFAATANVIEHVRARPVLVDVLPDTLQMDPAQVARAVTARTRAIMPVHFAGHPADLDPIFELAKRHTLLVLEDAAHALPARYRDRVIGSGSNPVAFSFYATKNLTTGEGGMLTGDPEFVRRARVISLHGLSHDGWNRYGEGGSWFYEVSLPGYKYNMTDIQAALGIWQLRKLGVHQARRRAVVAAYQAAFAGHDALETPGERPDVEHAWHLYVLRLRLEALAIDRARFIQELARRRIGASVHFIPVHQHPYYRNTYGYRHGDFPVTDAAYPRMVSLPLHPGLTDDDVADVVSAVLDICQEFRR